jgi:hypothetical protein
VRHFSVLFRLIFIAGSKIIGPHDKGISASIHANLEPKTWLMEQLYSSPMCLDRTQEMKDAYFSNLSALNLSRFGDFLERRVELKTMWPQDR